MKTFLLGLVITWLMYNFLVFIYSGIGILVMWKLAGCYFTDVFCNLDYISWTKHLLWVWPKYAVGAYKKRKWNRKNLLCLPSSSS